MGLSFHQICLVDAYSHFPRAHKLYAVNISIITDIMADDLVLKRVHIVGKCFKRFSSLDYCRYCCLCTLWKGGFCVVWNGYISILTSHTSDIVLHNKMIAATCEQKQVWRISRRVVVVHSSMKCTYLTLGNHCRNMQWNNLMADFKLKAHNFFHIDQKHWKWK